MYALSAIKATDIVMVQHAASPLRRERAGVRVMGAARPLSMMPAPIIKDQTHG